MSKPVFLAVINIVAFLATVAINPLAGSTTSLNGMTSARTHIFTWALIGILTKQSEYPSIVLVSQVGIVPILVAVPMTVAFSRLKR